MEGGSRYRDRHPAQLDRAPAMIEFRQARRESISLLVGLAGGTGSGKTYSALRLATGLAGGSPFGVIDTENGRASHYADDFAFETAQLEPPFSPERYLEAIRAADAAGYPAIVVDSASHEHAGTGGLLDMHDAELERMGGAAAANMAAWIKPKAEHKRFVSELLRLRAHLILCFRAEPKVEIRKKAGGGVEIVPKETLTGLDGWVPIAEKSLPFELTLSFLLMPDAPGIPKPIKLPERLRQYVPLDAPLEESVGVELATWARGEETVSYPELEDEETAQRLEELIADLLSRKAITSAQLEKAVGRPFSVSDLEDGERAGLLARLEKLAATLASA
jgi:AAA domain